MRKYDLEKNNNIYTCKACGYIHEEDTWGEEFIEFSVTIRKRKGWRDELEEKIMYACPICGTVFMEV